MPHQCVRCNTVYPDGAQEILKGCKCGARLFFYIKKKQLEEGKELISKLTEEEKKALIDYMYSLWSKEIQTKYDEMFK